MALDDTIEVTIPTAAVATMANTLKIAWWNTRLTPPASAAKALTGADRALALEVILTLCAEHQIIALGEVSPGDLEWVHDNLPHDLFAITDLTKSNSSLFNMGFIHRKQECELISFQFLTDNVTAKKIKIAAHVQFLCGETFLLDLLAVHWPSRLTHAQNSSVRSHFGHSLRKAVNRVRAEGRGHVIALGDFNDEPFDESMTDFLEASRDSDFVRRYPALLYNPFWKRIVCGVGYERSLPLNGPTGTYFFKGHPVHRWRVIDQMLFTSEFLGKSDWHLVEAETGVLRPEKLVAALQTVRSKLDHLPIFCTLSKDNANG